MEINLLKLLDAKAVDQLKELLDSETFAKVAELNIDSGSAKLIPLEKFNEQGEQVKALNEQLAASGKQLEELKAFKGTNEELNAKIVELQKANEAQAQEFNNKLNGYKLDVAWDKALTEAKTRNKKALRALIDADKVKLNESGELDGFKEQLEALRKSDSYLFEEEQKATKAGYDDKHNNDGLKDPNEEAFATFRNA